MKLARPFPSNYPASLRNPQVTWKHPFYDYFRQLREFCRQATRDEAGLGGSEFFHLYECLDELGCWMSIVN